MRYITDQQKENFFAKVLKNANEKGCWFWTACINEHGYGSVSLFDRPRKAHQISYRIANNLSLDKQLFLCHTCDIKHCVNPEHLYEGNHSKNLQDAYDRNLRQAPPKGTPPPQFTKINLEVARQIRELIKIKSLRAVSNELDVSYYIVKDISRGRTWRDA